MVIVNTLDCDEDRLRKIYCAARRCYSADGAMPHESDVKSMERLVEKVIKSGHTSILEHASFTFHVSGISRACSHQLVRHRMASYAQQSQRYADAQGAYVIPPKVLGDGKSLEAYKKIVADAMEAYKMLVAAGIPKEDARYVLPQAMCTSVIITMNARELYENFFPLRMCARAQWEIRSVAQAMYNACAEALPSVFLHTGARCALLGYCPEDNGCGKRPPLAEIARMHKEGFDAPDK